VIYFDYSTVILCVRKTESTVILRITLTNVDIIP